MNYNNKLFAELVILTFLIGIVLLLCSCGGETFKLNNEYTPIRMRRFHTTTMPGDRRDKTKTNYRRNGL